MITAQAIVNCVIFTLVSGGTFSLWQMMEKKWRRRLTLRRLMGPGRQAGPASSGTPAPARMALTRLALNLGRLAAPKNKGELAKNCGKIVPCRVQAKRGRGPVLRHQGGPGAASCLCPAAALPR